MRAEHKEIFRNNFLSALLHTHELSVNNLKRRVVMDWPAGKWFRLALVPLQGPSQAQLSAIKVVKEIQISMARFGNMCSPVLFVCFMFLRHFRRGTKHAEAKKKRLFWCPWKPK